MLTSSVIEIKNGKGRMEIPNNEDYVKNDSFRTAFFSRNLNLDYWYVMAYSATLDIPSSASGINFHYDDQNGFIQIEFSIPKFFFGNNVIELIPSLKSRHYSKSNLQMWKFAKYWYNIILSLPNRIIYDLTNGQFADVDLKDIQVYRLDVSFNQIFDTAKEAEHYFDALTKVNLPRLVDSGKYRYDTTNMFSPKGNDWSFKVYRKGVEFEKIGRKQIQKYMDRFEREGLLFKESHLVTSHIHMDEIQEYADRINRYELTGRNGIMSKLFNKNLKKRNLKTQKGKNVYWDLRDKVFYIMRPENLDVLIHLLRDGGVRYWSPRTEWYANTFPDNPENWNVHFFLPAHIVDPSYEGHYKTVRVESAKLLQRCERIYRTFRYLKMQYGIYNLKRLKDVAKRLRKEHDRSHDFRLAIDTLDSAKAILKPAQYSDVHYDVPAMGIMDETPDIQLFSPDIIVQLIVKHNKLFQALQFENLPPVKDMEMRARAYNDAIDAMEVMPGKKKPKKLHVSRIVILVELLQHKTFDQLKRSGKYDRVTLYRMEKDINMLLGLDKAKNFLRFADLKNVPRKPSDLYFRHYDYLIAAHNILSLFLENTPLLLEM